ncbi:hypothetical protein HDE_12763 [Halotydeus destructor]|nr:hypothetical protein HDE_12763 [Halotydeus destructor]
MNIDNTVYADVDEKTRIEPVREFYDKVQKYVGERSVRVLDLGCSIGSRVATVAEHLKVSKITAVDIDEDGIKYATQKYRDIEFRVSDCGVPWEKFHENTGVSEQSADVVLSTYAIHWLYTDANRMNVLGTIHKALSPGGQAHLQFLADYRSISELFKEWLEKNPNYASSPTRHEEMKNVDSQKAFWIKSCNEVGLSVLEFNSSAKTFHWPTDFLGPSFRVYYRNLIGQWLDNEDDIVNHFMADFRERLQVETVIKGDTFQIDAKDMVLQSHDLELHLAKA